MRLFSHDDCARRYVHLSNPVTGGIAGRQQKQTEVTGDVIKTKAQQRLLPRQERISQTVYI